MASDELMHKLLRKLKRAVLDNDPSFCDMYEDAHSRQAAQEYLSHIRPALKDTFGDKTLAMLDAGCQAGRLLIPLAQDGHKLVGVDTSGFALRRAQRHAQQFNVHVELHKGNIAQLRRWVSPVSLDVVICTEVLYLCRDHRALLKLLADSVKPGGLLCISHRPTVFYAGTALKRGDEAMASSVLTRTEGPSPDGTYHNWQNEAHLEALYQEAGAALLRCKPVDHTPMELDLSAARDQNLSQLFDPLHESGSVYRIPQYVLVIAQRLGT